LAYIGNDLQVAFPTYKNIDDISGSFNSSTTSFALLVSGAAPSPLPLNSQQCLISVGGVLQRPDDTGSEGFRLSGGNIVFSSAPATGADFFGVILAGADYVNAGGTFPDGSAAVPSITFSDDSDTGFFRSSSGAVSFSSNAVSSAIFGTNSFTAPSFIPTSSSVPTNGVFLPSANTVSISTNSTERARIDSSGRLLVGTSSTSAFDNNAAVVANFTHENSLRSHSSFISHNTSNVTGSTLFFGRSRSGSVGGRTIVNSGDHLGRVSFQGADGGAEFVEAAFIQAEVDGTPGTNDMPGRLVFSTTADSASSPTERMRIDNNGLIKTYSTGNGHTVNVSAGAGTTTHLYAGNRSSTDVQGSGGTTVYYVYSNGTVQNATGTYTTISDAKLKENIVEANSQWNDLKAIQIRNWNFKAETGHETHRQIGPIAQELEAVCPGLVFETPDRDADGNETGEVTKGVNQSVLYMKAVKALQEAMERIEQLETKVAALEAQ